MVSERTVFDPLKILAPAESRKMNKSKEMKSVLSQPNSLDDLNLDGYTEPGQDFLSLDLSYGTTQTDETTFVGYWDYPLKSVVSKRGRKIISQDPNLTKLTIDSLIDTEKSLCKSSDLKHALESDDSQLVFDEFFDNNATGYAHLSLCAKECVGRPMAELVDVFAEERGIPFVLAALYIGAFQREEGIGWIQVDISRGYMKVPWTPTEVTVIPVASLPPHIAKQIVEPKYHEPVNASLPVPEIKPCPICGSPAAVLRTGPKNNKWHVCCLDNTNSCFLSFGIPKSESATQRQAVEIWNTLVEEHTGAN